MKRWRVAVLLGSTVVALGACGIAMDSSGSKVAAGGADADAIVAVPRAACGPGSVEETGLQGQVTQADRQSGRSLQEYRCNLERLGQWRHGEGASWQFAWYEDCGYYGTLLNQDRETPPGTVVVQARDPAHPVETALLTTPAMMDPHESLKSNQERGLLGAVELSGGADAGPAGEDVFDLYDVKQDCAQPRLVASVAITGRKGHEGDFAPDGLTYWGSDVDRGTYYPIDISDPEHPVHLMNWTPSGGPFGVHGLSISRDGSRGYFAMIHPGTSTDTSANGLVIADTSDVQSRAPNPTIRVISRLTWADGAISQHSIPITIGGKPYLVFVEELGHGAARIIDISDETSPFVVSRLKLEVHLPENSAAVTPEGGHGPGVYDGHYCNVDRHVDTTAVACGYFESGIRVFDIRDPAHPKEIAYYNPGGLNQVLPASSHNQTAPTPVDHCTAQVRFVETPTGGQLWTQCQDNEFLVLKFTNGVWPFKDGA